jgi:hypothetical protein
MYFTFYTKINQLLQQVSQHNTKYTIKLYTSMVFHDILNKQYIAFNHIIYQHEQNYHFDNLNNGKCILYNVKFIANNDISDDIPKDSCLLYQNQNYEIDMLSDFCECCIPEFLTFPTKIGNTNLLILR